MLISLLNILFDMMVLGHNLKLNSLGLFTEDLLKFLLEGIQRKILKCFHLHVDPVEHEIAREYLFGVDRQLICVPFLFLNHVYLHPCF